MADHYAIAITEMDVDDDVFRTLGGAAWLTPTEQEHAWSRISEFDDPAGTSGRRQLSADLLDPFGVILAERTISPDTARRLLGVADLQPLRDKFDRELAEEVARHAQ